MSIKRFAAVFLALIFLFQAGYAAAEDLQQPELQQLLEREALHFSETVLTLPERDYEYAVDLLCTRHFSEAGKIFLSLKDYRNSRKLADLCRTYPGREPKGDGPLITDANRSREYSGGTLYSHPNGLFYIPHETNEKTSFVLYHSGGGGEEDYLYYEGLYPYFETYHPNAVIFFSNRSGIGDMARKNRTLFSVLQQLARECGLVPYRLSAIGSSSGCYTAIQAAPLIYQEYGIPLSNVCTLDTGMDWVSTGNLTDAQCDAVAEAGTVFYLFEQEYEGMRSAAIRNMVEHGIETWLIACKTPGHNEISVNAYVYGIFSWCAGDPAITLPDYEYVMIKLDPGMTDNGPVRWGMEPWRAGAFARDQIIQDAAR